MTSPAPRPSPIRDLEGLHSALVLALQIEHATIPPYLTALYSIHPGSNSEAVEVIRSVVVEEMLHLTLVANVLNAVGGSLRHTFTAPGFIPRYPAFLPTGATDFVVGLRGFSPATIDTFLQIERLPQASPGGPPRPSIGAFYDGIIRAMFALSQAMGEGALFSGDPARQVGPEQYYNGAGGLVVVHDFTTAQQALRLIQEQGEGSSGHRIYAGDSAGIHALGHYYRFQQLRLGRYYRTLQPGDDAPDAPDAPTGPELDRGALDWGAVYPIQPDLQIGHLPEGSAVRQLALTFAGDYQRFLGLLERAFDGAPTLLRQAVGGMFRLRDLAEQLVRSPIPGRGDCHAAPLYRLD